MNFKISDIRQNLKFDLSSGLVVFLVAIPLCLGIALASDAPMMSGIIAGLIGGIVIGIFGGSQLGVSGPAAGLVAVVLSAKTTLGSIEALFLATALAGVIQVVLGLIRAGTIAYYFPSSVIKGMLAAIGIIIFLKQIPHAVGFDKDYEGDLNFFQPDGHNTLTELGYMLDAIHPGAMIVAAVGLLVLILWDSSLLKNQAFTRFLPGPLVAVASGVIINQLFVAGFPDLAISSVHLVNLPVGENPAQWVTFPDFSKILDYQVWMVAGIIAAVASVESLLCAEATDKLDPQKRITPMNRELRAQGLGNIISGMIGGLPITQVIVRSSANIQSGGKTRMSAVFHGLLILFSVMLIPGILNMIPLASLAAILLVVGFKLAKPALIKKMYSAGWTQFIPFAVTIVAILLSDLLIGIGIGMAVGIFFILKDNYRIPYKFMVVPSDKGDMIVIRLSEVVSFLNKGNILNTLRMLPEHAKVVIDASDSVYIDPDVREVIEDFRKNEEQHGIELEMIGFDNNQEDLKPAKELEKLINGQRIKVRKPIRKVEV